MMNVISKIWIAASLLILSACGGGIPGVTDDSGCISGCDGGTPADFSIFPPGYFSGSYTETRNFSKEDTGNGQYFTNYLIQEIKSGADTTFSSRSVKTIETKSTITPPGSAPIISTSHAYWSTTSNLQFVGTHNQDSGSTTTATTNDDVPLRAAINDTGIYGEYTHSNGNRSEISWCMCGGTGNDTEAAFHETSKTYDSSDILISTAVSIRTITEDGTTQGMQITITDHQSSTTTRYVLVK